jgi:hypothetical protein
VPNLVVVRPGTQRELQVAPDAPRRAREFVAELLADHESALRYHAQLLTSEVVSYLLRCDGPGDDLLELGVELDPQSVHVEVSPTPGRRVVAGEDLSDEGPAVELQIVASVSDRWGIRSGDAAKIWFELDF